ncbi:hypothetical protein HYN59_14855 [Flavobacterium album]|uniref:DUF262 domain-containing protein n=1 Tax=Flavobacterium album TaxID=2175091 RepID=A0A2S1R0V9_9FLAO|nr:DUF262 domain-containing protein [Flavobacterium album]AWH86308.1 hypothetical protein HYN59_14855 [Flavobacterium album]
MDAGKRTINDIFNGNRILEVPFFQRAYVWGEDQWERLLEDMENVSSNVKPYFLGSVILKQQPTPTGSIVGDVRTVIDGQQRLTTLNIFFKVLCLMNGQVNMFDRTFRLMNNDIAIKHNHNDAETFEFILNLTELIELDQRNNIFKAYEYFRKNISVEKLNIQHILSSILFVGIDLSAHEDEQQIFDTINSLGVTLTTAELLKNYFFNRDIVSYELYWKKVFEEDDETKSYWDREFFAGRLKRTFIDLFFYSYLQIKIQQADLKVKTEDKIEFSKVEALFESYKKFINDYQLDKVEILQEIKEYAILFKNSFDHSITASELTEVHGIERINAIIFGLETTTIIPYVLYVLRNVKDAVQRDDLFHIIESYLMRRMIVHSNTKNYNQLFTDRLIANEILSKDMFLDYINLSSDKVNYYPGDDELLKGFEQSILVNKQAAGILYMIESKIRNRQRHSTQLLGMNKYSLEHLMPKKWENHWNTGLSKEEVDFRNRKLLTLGNLAIITQSLNASIRDSDWESKKEGKGNRFGLKHFSSGIETHSSYLALDAWNEEAIAGRGYDLYELAKSIWPN